MTEGASVHLRRRGAKQRGLGVVAVVLGMWAVLGQGVITLLMLYGAVPPTVGPPLVARAAVLVSLGGLAAAGFATYAGIRLITGRAYGLRWWAAMLAAL